MNKFKKLLFILIPVICLLIAAAIIISNKIISHRKLVEAYGALADALMEHNIESVYSTAPIKKEIGILTKEQVKIIEITSVDVVSPDVSKSNSPFYIILDNDTILENKDTYRMHFASEVTSGQGCTLYSYENIDYMLDENLISDLTSLDENSYDSYFISMFDITGFNYSDFMFYTGIKPYIFQKTISTADDLKYLDLFDSYIFEGIMSSTETDLKKDPSIVYVGIDPFMIRELCGDTDYKTFVAEKAESVIKTHIYTSFQIILPYYYIGHYTSMSPSNLTSMKDCYVTLAECLSGYSNVKLHFMGDTDWIYSNKYIFNEGSDISVKATDSHKFTANILTEVHVTEPEDISDKITSLQQLVLNYDMNLQKAADLSDTCVVIFGDSIFDLVRDDTSIQDVFSNYSGASNLCYAIGGAPAAKLGTIGYTEILGGELYDLSSIREDITREMSEKNKLIFILEFGLNDYFNAVPVSNPDDPDDADTYEGALRTAVKTIRSEWPDSEIIIMAPGHIGFNDNGQTPCGENGGDLAAYRNSSAKLAEELDLHLMDLSTYLGFTEENFSEYCLADKVHYNNSGRLIAGRKLIEYIDSEF